MKDYLGGDGLNPAAVEWFIRDAIDNSWRQDNEPFAAEYSGGRRWNRVGAQLALQPADEGGNHPSWDMVFNHCGRGLDETIAESDWAYENGVLCGGDFLRLWAALLFRKPRHPLPYLFIFSPEQSTGKSTLGFSLRLLFRDDRGFVLAEQALESEGGFNGELDGAVLCLVEEVDLSGRGHAYHRLKNWVTAPQIMIHPKGKTAYTATNFSHWIQTANDVSHCPIFSDDTRIVMIEAQPFAGRELSWDSELKPMLLEEAPRFLRTLFDLELPAPKGRLWLPVIETQAKLDAMGSADAREKSEAQPRVDHGRLALAILGFLMLQVDHHDPAERLRWQGRTSELLAALPPGGPWPSHAAAFGRELRNVEQRLAEMGIVLSHVPPSGKNRQPLLEATESFSQH